MLGSSNKKDSLTEWLEKMNNYTLEEWENMISESGDPLAWKEIARTFSGTKWTERILAFTKLSKESNGSDIYSFVIVLSTLKDKAIKLLQQAADNISNRMAVEKGYIDSAEHNKYCTTAANIICLNLDKNKLDSIANSLILYGTNFSEILTNFQVLDEDQEIISSNILALSPENKNSLFFGIFRKLRKEDVSALLEI